MLKSVGCASLFFLVNVRLSESRNMELAVCRVLCRHVEVRID